MAEKFTILGRRFYPYQVGLLRACERLHDITTGAGDCYEPVTPWFLFQYLSMSIERWREEEPGYSAAVKALICCALSEYVRFFDVKEERSAAEKFSKEFPLETDAILSQIRGADGEKITVHRVD
jgi:hypothetical protein